MKKIIALITALSLCLLICACGKTEPTLPDDPVPTQIPYAQREAITDGESALTRLIDGNLNFMRNYDNSADITRDRRIPIAYEGTNPYALVVCCADSTCTPEFIFDTGLGDLIVLRTFGNVIGDYEKGAIEYAIEQKGVKLVVVLGHTYCDAIKLTIDEEGEYDGHTQTHKKHMESYILEDAAEAKFRPVEEDEYDHYDRLSTEINITQSLADVMYDSHLGEVIEANEVKVVGGIYNTASGRTDFLWDFSGRK